MAKMFYRFEEAKQVLNMSDEQLKQLTREGKLREFRDGAQVMYKADQVDSLRGELGLGDAIELGPGDTAGSIGLADTRSNTASGSVISLADTNSKEDTAMDLGLSTPAGSGTGLAMASPGNSGSGSGTGIGLAGTHSGTGIDLAGATGTGMAMNSPSASGTNISTRTGSGVSVLGLDEGGNADPSAQTVGGSFSAEPSLDAMGSGSGLLDLSRERDDTSLGAPVLDEISGSGRGGLGGAASGSSMGLSGSGPISGAPLTGAGTASIAARGGSVPIYVEASDNFTGLAAGLAAACAIMCVVALYAVAAAAANAQPALLGFLFSGEGAVRKSLPMLYVLGAGLVLAIVLGLVGFIVGKRK